MSACNSENLVNAVKAYLASHHMLAYDTWIEGCVDYFKDSNDAAKIQTIAHEQWLLHDLTEICPGSLPADLDTLKKTVLNGHHVLQINGALDISVPAYQQYLKMQKTDTENIKATMNPEEKISSKRMLKLDMTDGKKTVVGIEYETIHKLKNDIKPGSKILIKGPVQCRQGMLLLTDKTVEMLNGEVPEMALSHSLAAQLANKLGLPMITEVDNAESEMIETTHTAATHSILTNIATTRQNTREHHETNTNRTTNSNLDRDDDFPDIVDLDDDFYDAPLESSAKRQLTESTVPQNSEKKIKIDDTNPAVSRTTNHEYPDDDDLEFVFEDEEYLREIENQCEERFNQSFQEISPKGPIQLSTEPFVYIKQINDLSDSEKSGRVFRVKAQILTVLTKLTITDRWNLKCRITDGTGCMDVEFASDILSGFLGYTPQDISELKKIISTNPDIKNQINLAYKKTTKTLETLYCILELTMVTPPRITKTIEFEDFHADLLKRSDYAMHGKRQEGST